MAIALLLGRLLPSTVPGTTALALRFSTCFAITQVIQPTTAFRLLRMIMSAGYHRASLRGLDDHSAAQCLRDCP